MLRNERTVLVMLCVIMVVKMATPLTISPKLAASVVTAIRQFFRSDCVYFISSESIQERLHVVRVQKQLAQQGAIFTKALLYGTVHLKTKFLTLSCNAPVYVMFSDNMEVKPFLREAASKISLADSVWLLIMTSSGSVDDMFLDVHVPFNAEFLVAQQYAENVIALTEVYRVAKNTALQKYSFSVWTGKGMTPPVPEMYVRRSSLQGLVLRAGDVHFPMVSVVNVKNNVTTLGGFSGEVWGMLEEIVNFTTIHSLPTDGGLWGSLVGNNTWDGTINMLLTDQVDVVSSATSMSSERIDVVKFAMPLYMSTYRVYLRNFDNERRIVNWNDWLAPFSPQLWLFFLLHVVLTAMLMYVVCLLVRRLGSNREQKMTLYDQLFLIYGAIFCQQGQVDTPVSWPCRILFFVAYVTGVILISSYSGSIISNLTVVHSDLPFSDLDGLFKDGHIGLGMLAGTFIVDIFKNSDNAVLQQLYVKYVVDQPKNLLESNYAGFRRVCREPFAFISNPEIVSAERANLKCTIVSLPQMFVKYTNSFILPKNSPYIGIFNHKLMKLLNNGALRKTYSAHMGYKQDEAKPGFQSILLEDVTPMLTIVAGGVIAGALVVTAEQLAVKYNLHRRWRRMMTASWERVVDYARSIAWSRRTMRSREDLWMRPIGRERLKREHREKNRFVMRRRRE